MTLKRLLRITLLSTLIWCVLIVSALLPHRAEQLQTSLQALGFDLCDGVPCFQGILPGKTTWDEMTEIASRSTYTQTVFNARSVVLRLPDGDLTYSRALTDRLLPGFTYIGRFAPVGMRLGDFVRLYGSPCRVQPTDFATGQFVSVMFSSMWLEVAVQNGRVNPTSRVIRFSVPSPALAARGRDESQCLIVYPKLSDSDWRGFATLSHYRRAGVSP